MSRRKSKGASTPPTPAPAAAQDELFRRTDISPEEFFEALGRARKAARDEIEKLIDWLDSTIDVDEDSAADDEPCDGEGDFEPSLGSFDRLSNQIAAWKATTLYGNGYDVDAELDRCDAEPSLGWNAVEAASGRFSGRDDREDDGDLDDESHDGGEPDREDGPGFAEGALDQTVPPYSAESFDGIGGSL